MKALKTFRDSEDGAVTVDWVVLAAMVVALGALAGTAMNTEVTAFLGTLAGDVEAFVTGAHNGTF